MMRDLPPVPRPPIEPPEFFWKQRAEPFTPGLSERERRWLWTSAAKWACERAPNCTNGDLLPVVQFYFLHLSGKALARDGVKSNAYLRMAQQLLFITCRGYRP